MTAVPNWDIVGSSGSDAELARASAAGDRTAFADIYDRYADRLHDFCVGMLADRDGAADCVQDVFCIAATRLPQLRDPDKLRPGSTRSPATRRCGESVSVGAKHHPKSCPIRTRVNPVRRPWPRAPNSPI
jgi:hypothetical protein